MDLFDEYGESLVVSLSQSQYGRHNILCNFWLALDLLYHLSLTFCSRKISSCQLFSFIVWSYVFFSLNLEQTCKVRTIVIVDSNFLCFPCNFHSLFQFNNESHSISVIWVLMIFAFFNGIFTLEISMASSKFELILSFFVFCTTTIMVDASCFIIVGHSALSIIINIRYQITNEFFDVAVSTISCSLKDLNLNLEFIRVDFLILSFSGNFSSSS